MSPCAHHGRCGGEGGGGAGPEPCAEESIVPLPAPSHTCHRAGTSLRTQRSLQDLVTVRSLGRAREGRVPDMGLGQTKVVSSRLRWKEQVQSTFLFREQRPLSPPAAWRMETEGFLRLGAALPSGNSSALFDPDKFAENNTVQEAVQSSFDPLNVSKQNALRGFLFFFVSHSGRAKIMESFHSLTANWCSWNLLKSSFSNLTKGKHIRICLHLPEFQMYFR